jgi:hypothetical protein
MEPAENFIRIAFTTFAQPTAAATAVEIFSLNFKFWVTISLRCFFAQFVREL